MRIREEGLRSEEETEVTRERVEGRAATAEEPMCKEPELEKHGLDEILEGLCAEHSK